MIKNAKLIKDNVNYTQVKCIRSFTELGATKKLFDVFWAGQYIRIIDTALALYPQALPFEKSIKIGATSWISGRVIENNAYLVFAIYKQIAPDNSELLRDITPAELSLVTTIYNIKYYNSSTMIITKVFSLLNGLIKGNCEHDQGNIRKSEGISVYNCACGNYFVARCSTAAATCQWCRSKIKKITRKPMIQHESPTINIWAISRLTPNN